MSTQLGRTRVSDHDFAALVGQALLNLDDVGRLADSPLVLLPEVQRRLAGSTRLFADGDALADYLSETARDVAGQLPTSGRLALMRATLRGVCEGKSVAAIAREQGKSPEHFSRSYWSSAVRLVARQLSALPPGKRLPYNGGTGRKTDTCQLQFHQFRLGGIQREIVSLLCGSSSVVELLPSKQAVARSNRVSRSTPHRKLA